MIWTIELFIVYLGLFGASMVFTVIFPYASEMVMSFGETSDKNQTGYYVGVIGGALMIGRFIMAIPWGLLVDSWGRKPVTQIGLLGLAVSSILFGMSSNLPFAIFTRFLIGVLSPLMISSRTIISELSKPEDLPVAMAYIGISWNLGSVISNLIGGYLSNPESKGFDSIAILNEFPYLLPSLIPSLVSFIAFILGAIYLRETLKKNDETLIEKPQIQRSFYEICKDPKVFISLLAYFITSFQYTAFFEMFTLFSWAKSDSGGLELTTEEIGLILSITYCILLTFLIPLYSYLTKLYGVIKITRYGFWGILIVTVLIPLTGLLSESPYKKPIIIAGCTLWFTFNFMTDTGVMVVNNGTVDPRELGRLNGISMLVNCGSRALAPIICGAVFAWSASSSLRVPLNIEASFLFLAAVESVGLYCSYRFT